MHCVKWKAKSPLNTDQERLKEGESLQVDCLCSFVLGHFPKRHVLKKQGCISIVLEISNIMCNTGPRGASCKEQESARDQGSNMGTTRV